MPLPVTAKTITTVLPTSASETSRSTFASTVRASRQQWLAEKKIAVLAQGALMRNPELPNVPMMLEETTSPLHKQVLTLLLSTLPMARPFGMPPGTPKDRLQAMRTAFVATMRDPAFLEEAKAATLDIDPMPGEDMAAMLAKAYAMPAEVVREAARAVGN